MWQTCPLRLKALTAEVEKLKCPPLPPLAPPPPPPPPPPLPSDSPYGDGDTDVSVVASVSAEAARVAGVERPPPQPSSLLSREAESSFGSS